jgi:hypothetical protein
MCLYDMDQFGSGALVNLVMTHPRMLMGGMVIENPYYLTADEVLAKAVRRDTGTVIPLIKEAEEWYSDVMTG